MSPLMPQLGERLVAHRREKQFASSTDLVSATSRGTSLGVRNVASLVGELDLSH